jgi:hypothetical protein
MMKVRLGQCSCNREHQVDNGVVRVLFGSPKVEFPPGSKDIDPRFCTGRLAVFREKREQRSADPPRKARSSGR